jgi:hypothetical protein
MDDRRLVLWNLLYHLEPSTGPPVEERYECN